MEMTAIRPNPKPVLIVQERWVGEGLEWLEANDTQAQTNALILTENPCPEYALDLLEYRPAGLIVCPSGERFTALGRALSLIHRGNIVREHPRLQTRLLPSERALLRLLSRQVGTREIAEVLSLSHKTVRNRISEIGQKLELENRSQIVMYYTGQWQWLRAHREALESFCARGGSDACPCCDA